MSDVPFVCRALGPSLYSRGVIAVADLVYINDVLDSHVVLDLDCFDRIFLNAYVTNIQVGRQMVTFMTQHLGVSSHFLRFPRITGVDKRRKMLNPRSANRCKTRARSQVLISRGWRA